MNKIALVTYSKLEGSGNSAIYAPRCSPMSCATPATT